MKRAWLLAAAIAMLWSLGVLADGDANPHEQYVQSYEGTKTCLKCHKYQAYEFFFSDHYQWKGPNPNLVPMPHHQVGKINSVNGFCMDPRANWMTPVIKEMPNGKKKVIFSGCSACHAGHGKLPTGKATQDQLENIDCLICHAKNYKRMPKKVGDHWEYVPAMEPGKLLEAVQHPIMPGKAECMRCHLKAGGGPNFKGGDLESALITGDRTFDVHMGKGGAGLGCLDCHKAGHHRLKGTGADGAVNETPGEELKCANCHTTAPHDQAILNMHTNRVACETCHIPTFARTQATDMFRDWRKNHFIKKKGIYDVNMKLEKNVVPEYRWWNGRQKNFWDPATPVRLNKKGGFYTYTPVGSKADPKSKIYPFKHHVAWVAYDGKTHMILPVSIKYMLGHKDNIGGIKAVSRLRYGHLPNSVKWAKANRWHTIEHGVVPKKNALKCQDCHGKKGRINWKALGFPGNPAPGASLE